MSPGCSPLGAIVGLSSMLIIWGGDGGGIGIGCKISLSGTLWTLGPAAGSEGPIITGSGALGSTAIPPP